MPEKNGVDPAIFETSSWERLLEWVRRGGLIPLLSDLGSPPL